jgi:hypothetical protein
MRLLRPFVRPLLSLPWLVTACQAPDIPVSTGTGCHPACPGAAAARIADPGNGLSAEGSEPAPSPGVLDAPGPGPQAYLCPMHLALGSDEPGRCPACNMKLVPRAQALEHDHGR